MPVESCIGGLGSSKSSWDPKTVDYSPRKRPKMPEIRSFDDASRVVYRGSWNIEILPGPKTVDYSPRKRPVMTEITSLDDPARNVYRGSRSIEILPGPENRGLTIAHENGQKCPKSLVLTMPLESCTGGHGASKSSRDPKTIDYSPRKRPEMPEIMSFDDASRVVYWGSRDIEILPGPNNRGL